MTDTRKIFITLSWMTFVSPNQCVLWKETGVPVVKEGLALTHMGIEPRIVLLRGDGATHVVTMLAGIFNIKIYSNARSFYGYYFLHFIQIDLPLQGKTSFSITSNQGLSVYLGT